jgi:hypothetical protein
VLHALTNQGDEKVTLLPIIEKARHTQGLIDKIAEG